jgi:hypothetical protein
MTILGDDTVMPSSDSWKSLKPDELEDWFNAVADFDSWSESFESACIP